MNNQEDLAEKIESFSDENELRRFLFQMRSNGEVDRVIELLPRLRPVRMSLVLNIVSEQDMSGNINELVNLHGKVSRDIQEIILKILMRYDDPRVHQLLQASYDSSTVPVKQEIIRYFSNISSQFSQSFLERIGGSKMNRFRFLNLLYKKSGGDENKDFNMFDLGHELGLDREDIKKVVQYLKEENLIKHAGMGGAIVITHHGVKEIEKAQSKPKQETSYYFPVTNILEVHGNVLSSQLQVGTQASQQLQINPDLQRALIEFLSELEKRIAEITLEESKQHELRTSIETIKAQLRALEPKHSIIKEALLSIKRILEHSGGALLAMKVAELIARFG